MYQMTTLKIFVEDLASPAPGKDVTDCIIDTVLSLFSEAQTDITCLCAPQVTITLQLKSFNFKHGRRQHLSHGAQIHIGDPLGTKEADINFIEDQFVKFNLNVSMSKKWIYCRQVSYDLQKDSSSCGVFILKYAYDLGFNSKPKLSVNNLDSGYNVPPFQDGCIF